MLLRVLLATAAAAASHPLCDIRVGELVPNAQVARELAEVVIRNRQTEEQRLRYSLHVKQDGTRGWLVFQSFRDNPSRAKGTITLIAGGGLGMRIDRCTGAMSRVHYQR